MGLRLEIAPNPAPQGRGEHVYQVAVAADADLLLHAVRMEVGDYVREWPAAEFFRATALGAGQQVAGTGRNLARSEGALARWTVRATTVGGTSVTATAAVALTLPAGAERLLYRRDPAREGILSLPPGPGPHPGLILVHGSGSSAGTIAWMAAAAAAHGYAGFAVSQPGFGGSAGPADYVGPVTQRAILDGLEWLQMHPRLDPGRIALWGVSRGAMAAAMAAVQTRDLRALVLQSGAYDLTQVSGQVARGAAREGAAGPQALAERSACRRAQDFSCPVLLVHGERDELLPPEQAERLHVRLQELGKAAELAILPGKGHFLPPGPVWAEHIYPFLRRCGLL